MIAAHLIAALCLWSNPGADRTTSPLPATLFAMGIVSPELAHKIEAGDYSEAVTIHKNDRRLYGMTSGDARWCAGEVDTSRWVDGHEEQGRVYRVGDLAVVWFWRCHNLSLWRPPVDVGPIAAAGPDLGLAGAPVDAAEAAQAPLGGPVGAAPAAFGGAEQGGGYSSGWAGVGGAAWGGGGVAAWGGGGTLIEACSCCGVPMVPAVPESSAWVLLIGGMAAVAVRSKRA